METIQEQLNFFNGQLMHIVREANWHGSIVCNVHEGAFTFGMHVSPEGGKEAYKQTLLVAYSSILKMMRDAKIEPREILNETKLDYHPPGVSRNQKAN